MDVIRDLDNVARLRQHGALTTVGRVAPPARSSTMESQLLEYLLRVAELGSINKAALDLQLSQPALSRHIARLEEEMGVKLFVRAQSGVRPTDAGLLLCERARPLLRQFTLIKEEVGDKAAGVLSVGIAASWQRVFTSKFVATLVQQYPAISLRVVEGLSDRLRDNMLEGLLDPSAQPCTRPSRYRCPSSSVCASYCPAVRMPCAVSSNTAWRGAASCCASPWKPTR
jgi:molybdenum-dependent DNA-binding transcriptional regulator ModE